MTIVTPAATIPVSTHHQTGKDATALLKADHDAIAQSFADFERAHSVADKKALVASICRALRMQARLETELFFPAVEAALRERLLVPVAQVEQACIEYLVRQLDGAEPDGATYDARVRVLSETVKHHVRRVQNEMFPKARESIVDLVTLGGRMAARQAQLLLAAAPS